MSNLPPTIRSINPQGWMQEDVTQNLMRALNTENAQTLFVGGCVRNALLNLPVEDADLATQFTPQEAAERLEAAGFRVIPTGIDHGTITAIGSQSGGRHFEITTLRRDVSTDGRRATVAFSRDWAEDAARRDFTMNTLLADIEGRVYDPLGQGLEHLAARRVVFVGEPQARIAEDYLRILRFFRFHAAYGSGEPDAVALSACKAAASQIQSLSRERITQEIFKILVVDNPVDIFESMFKNNVLYDFFVSEDHHSFFRHFCAFQARYGLISLNSRLFVMLGMELARIKTAEKFLLFPKVFQRDFQAMSDCLAGDDLSQDRAVRESVYRFGRTIAAQVLMIELAQDRVMNGYAPKALEIIQTWEIPDFPLSGDDLLKAGMKPGPELGAALEAIENFWIAQDFKPDRAACLARLKSL